MFWCEFGVAAVLSGVVDAVLVADYFPELGSDLVAALAALDVEDFSHFLAGRRKGGNGTRDFWLLYLFSFFSFCGEFKGVVVRVIWVSL